MIRVYADFESSYGTRLTLETLSYTEYCTHDDFFVWGAPVAIEDEPFKWYGHNDLKQLFNDLDPANTRFIAHNVLFDATVARHRYEFVADQMFCTMAATNYLRPKHPANIGAVAEWLGYEGPKKEDLTIGLTATYNKALGELTQEEYDKLVEYAINDGEMLRFIHKKLEPYVPEKEQWLMNHSLQLAQHPSLLLDVNQWDKVLSADKATRQKQIVDSGYSGQQLRQNEFFAGLLRDKGIEPPTVSVWDKKQQKQVVKYSFSKNDARFLALLDNPDTVKLAKAKMAASSSQVSSKLKKLKNHAEANHGKVPVYYKYYGAHPGRFSGSNRLNLTNMPRYGGLRECLKAPDGHKLVIVDSSNIEARKLAWLSNCTRKLKEFELGVDPYIAVASEIAGFPVNEEDHPKERGLGKVVELLSGYQGGWSSLQRQMAVGAMGTPRRRISDAEAKKYINTYRRVNREIQRYWYKLQDYIPAIAGNEYIYVESLGLCFGFNTVRTMAGTYLRYPGFCYHNGEWKYGPEKQFKLYGGKLTENLCQHLSREIIMFQLRMVEETLGYPVVLHTYDELVLIVPDDQSHEVLQAVTDIMCIAPDWCSDIPLAAKGMISENYCKG